MSLKNFVDLGSKPVVTGVSASALTYFLANDGGYLPIAGFNVPSFVLHGLIVGVSTFAENVVNDFVLKMILPKSIQDMPKVLNPVATGVAAMGAYNLMSIINGNGYIMPMRTYMYAFMLGAGAQLIGEFISNTVTKPLVLSTHPGSSNTKRFESKVDAYDNESLLIASLPGLGYGRGYKRF